MLSRPVDLLFAIIEIHLPTSRTVIGGIEKLPSGLSFLPHKLLSKVEQTKFVWTELEFQLMLKNVC